jgi:FkbM family methyltransferase
MNIRRLFDHAERISRQVGRRVRIGKRSFRVRGYLSNILAVNPDDEPEVTAALTRVLSRPGTFIDVGANVGQTLIKVLAIDPDRSYVGFEPQVGACHYIDRFLKDNGLKNALVLPFGLSDSDGLKPFWSVGEADTMAGLLYDGEGRSRSVIMTRTGDDVLKELEVHDIVAIKVDVEGMELEVFRGFHNTLSNIGPPIIFEVNPNVDADGHTDLPIDVVKANSARASELYAYLSSLGYRIFELGTSGEEREVGAFELDDPARISSGSNFIAKKD